MADSVPDPRCALFDESGTHVLCMKRRPDWRTALCIETLALLNHVDDYWGDQYRTLVFPHDDWVERNGVWRENGHARGLREKGRPPKPRHHVLNGPARLVGEPLPTRGPLRYPTFVRCPGCRTKRLLDARVLDVVSVEDIERHVTQRAQGEGLSVFGPVLFGDQRGVRIGLVHLYRESSAVRHGRCAGPRRMQAAARALRQLQRALEDIDSLGSSDSS